MKKEVKKLLTLCCILAFAVVFLIYLFEDSRDLESVLSHVSGDAIHFSQETGYYTDTLKVNLTLDLEVPASASIYYTLNGDDPTVAGKEYNGAITLNAPESNVKIYGLKAVLYYRGQFSSPVERTYVIGNENTQLSIPVVNISCSQASLYDSETGIYANYSARGDEWVRDAHITMLDETGDVLLDQAVGIAVSGGTSSAYPVKSLKVIAELADESFDSENEKLELDFLCGNRLASFSSFVTTYNSIRLRSGSQDSIYGNIRSSVISRLAEDSGFDGCAMTQRCAFYLNGAFNGIYDIQQNYSDSYLARRFGLPDTNIAKWKGKAVNVFTNAGVIDLFDLDLNDPQNRELLEQAVDMDNYLLYYAINILANNLDWPDNNFEIWKYTGEYDPDNPLTDGRMRFLIYDTDLIYFSNEDPDFFDTSVTDIFRGLMDGERGTGSGFANVMQSEYYRNRFLTIVSDLQNTSFATEHVLTVVNEEWGIIEESCFDLFGQETAEYQAKHIERMRESIRQRDGELEADFAEYFQLKETYSVSIRNEGAASISWNQMTLFQGETYENAYYCGTDFTLEAAAYPGYEFCYWLVNGESVYSSTLTLSGGLAEDGNVVIETVTRPLDGPQIIISELSANQANDWIRITNVGQENVMLSAYYLTDSASNYREYQLPAVNLAPNQSIVIDGKSNYYALGDYICNFNMNEDEVLYLTDGTTVIDRMAVPRMGALESYGRYDESTVLKYFYNPNGERKTAWT